MKTTMTVPEFMLDEIRLVFRQNFTTDPEQSCLQWAMAVQAVCHRHGMNAHLQAGSVSWQMIPDWLDDGKCDNHFGYIFEPVPAAVRMAQGLMPEMHCWTVMPEEEILIDMTTGFQNRQCQRMIKRNFHPECVPPPYFWGSYGAIPKGWVYRADQGAMQAAFSMARFITAKGGSVACR